MIPDLLNYHCVALDKFLEISIALSFYFIKLGVDVIPRPIDLVPSIVFMNATKAGHTCGAI